jgi:hypothetical protein
MVSLVPGILLQSGRKAAYHSCPASPSQLSPQAFLFHFFAFQIPNYAFLKDPPVLRVTSSSDFLLLRKAGSHTTQLRFFSRQKCYICLQ